MSFLFRKKDSKPTVSSPLSSEMPERYESEKGRIDKSKVKGSLKSSTFSRLALLQEYDCSTPVWVLKSSLNGKYLAAGCQDGRIIVWDLIDITQYNEPCVRPPIFKPFKYFEAHTAAITDLSWSKFDFLLSSSLDGLVHIWHIDYATTLCAFKHSDAVSCTAFHPKDSTIFASTCTDGKLRLWSIPQKKLIAWNQVYQVPLTALCFSNDGSTIIIGTVTGTLLFYETDGLKYNTQILVNTVPNAIKPKECKINGIQLMMDQKEYILVSTTDSRVKLFALSDKSLVRSYRGVDIKSSRNMASFSPKNEWIICPSEDGSIVIWDTIPSESQRYLLKNQDTQEKITLSTVPKTVAMFAPLKTIELVDNNRKKCLESSDRFMATRQESLCGTIVITANVKGMVRIYENDPVMIGFPTINSPPLRHRSMTEIKSSSSSIRSRTNTVHEFFKT